MIEFIEECRDEWKRLGVPGAIANEMALDLTADIEEAEAEGGSAEDALGTSLFDPRRFAAAWARARGVTTQPPGGGASDPFARPRRPWRRSVAVGALCLVGIFLVLAATAIVFGHHHASVSVSVGRLEAIPGSSRWVVPTPAITSFRNVVPGPPPAGPSTGPVAMLAIAVVLAAVVAFGLAAVCWLRSSRHQSARRPW